MDGVIEGIRGKGGERKWKKGIEGEIGNEEGVWGGRRVKREGRGRKVRERKWRGKLRGWTKLGRKLTPLPQSVHELRT